MRQTERKLAVSTTFFGRMTCLAVAAPTGLTWAVVSGGESSIKIGVIATLAGPTVQDRLKAIDQDVWPADEQTPEALAARHKAELARWSPIIKEAGVKAE
jgi:tripartite-type tricarboxylate transporter receptor subunit TctC